MAQEAKGIRYQSEHFATVQDLMHSVNEQSLMAEHRKQSRKKAAGIDGVSKVQNDENAKENIQRLVERMKKFQYKRSQLGGRISQKQMANCVRWAYLRTKTD